MSEGLKSSQTISTIRRPLSDAVLDLFPLALPDGASALLVPVLPYVAAAAQSIASPVASQHRSCGDEKGRQVHGDCTHKQSRCGLVATAHQHRTVDRVGAQEFFGLHGEEVPVEHRRGFL